MSCVLSAQPQYFGFCPSFLLSKCLNNSSPRLRPSPSPRAFVQPQLIGSFLLSFICYPAFCNFWIVIRDSHNNSEEDGVENTQFIQDFQNEGVLNLVCGIYWRYWWSKILNNNNVRGVIRTIFLNTGLQLRGGRSYFQDPYYC